MKYLPLVWAAIMRKPARAVLTLLSVMILSISSVTQSRIASFIAWLLLVVETIRLQKLTRASSAKAAARRSPSNVSCSSSYLPDAANCSRSAGATARCR